jgi:hypothetical protein
MILPIWRCKSGATNLVFELHHILQLRIDCLEDSNHFRSGFEFEQLLKTFDQSGIIGVDACWGLHHFIRGQDVVLKISKAISVGLWIRQPASNDSSILCRLGHPDYCLHCIILFTDPKILSWDSTISIGLWNSNPNLRKQWFEYSGIWCRVGTTDMILDTIICWGQDVVLKVGHFNWALVEQPYKQRFEHSGDVSPRNNFSAPYYCLHHFYLETKILSL